MPPITVAIFPNSNLCYDPHGNNEKRGERDERKVITEVAMRAVENRKLERKAKKMGQGEKNGATVAMKPKRTKEAWQLMTIPI